MLFKSPIMWLLAFKNIFKMCASKWLIPFLLMPFLSAHAATTSNSITIEDLYDTSGSNGGPNLTTAFIGNYLNESLITTWASQSLSPYTEGYYAVSLREVFIFNNINNKETDWLKGVEIQLGTQETPTSIEGAVVNQTNDRRFVLPWTYETAASSLVRYHDGYRDVKFTVSKSANSYAIDISQITTDSIIASSDARLSALVISSGTLSPTFVSWANQYNATVANNVTSITVTPTVKEPGSTVTVNGVAVPSGSSSSAISLDMGVNIITVVSTAQDGVSTSTYTISVTREGSTDATLSNLTISEGTLSPNFDSTVLSYTASVGNTITSLTVTPTVNDNTATVTVNGTAVSSGNASGAISLNVGDNTITVEGTAQDGTTTSTYTIVVTRAPATDATLSNLTISEGTLSPEFDTSTNSYAVFLLNEVGSVTVTPTVNEPNATVTVNGLSVVSGSPSEAISLRVGDNSISIESTAQDGTTKISYTIIVNREGSPASEFEQFKEDVKQAVTELANLNLRNSLTSNSMLMREARERFILDNQASSRGLSSGDELPDLFLNGGGTLEAFNVDTSVAHSESLDINTRRVFRGNLVATKVQGGSTSLHGSIRVATERRVSEDNLLAYFVGADFGQDKIDSTFKGDQDSFAIGLGGYTINRLDDNLYFDGSAGIEVRRNDLKMSNDILQLTSDYETVTGILSAALTGVYAVTDELELWPELSVTYGKTFMGDIKFTGTAYGLTNSNLTLKAGTTSIGLLTFAPELRVPFDGLNVAKSASVMNVAPRWICEVIQATEDSNECGYGVQVRYKKTWDEASKVLNIGVISDRVGDATSTTLSLEVKAYF